MDKSEMREMILEAIGRLGVKSFGYGDMENMIGVCLRTERDGGNPGEVPSHQDVLTEVIRDLVVERIICPVPHGVPTFFINKKQ